LSRFVNFIIYF